VFGANGRTSLAFDPQKVATGRIAVTDESDSNEESLPLHGDFQREFAAWPQRLFRSPEISQGFQDFITDSPYPPPLSPQPRKKSKVIWIVLGTLLLGGVVVCACCGGFVCLGFGVMSTQIANDLRDNPAMRQHVGEIQSFKCNIIASAAEEDEDTFVFDVVGDKGTGTVTVKSMTDADGNEEIIWARLRTSDGSTIDLVTE
jgi:hypothetical protein